MVRPVSTSPQIPWATAHIHADLPVNLADGLAVSWALAVHLWSSCCRFAASDPRTSPPRAPRHGTARGAACIVACLPAFCRSRSAAACLFSVDACIVRAKSHRACNLPVARQARRGSAWPDRQNSRSALDSPKDRLSLMRIGSARKTRAAAHNVVSFPVQRSTRPWRCSIAPSWQIPR
jgi:hypothetical protein